MYTSYYQVAPNTYREIFGLGFEHLKVGLRISHRPGITISQQDNIEEALDSVNAAMIHYDHAYAGHTTWKQPLVVSTITLQRLVGMAAKTFGRHRKRIISIEEIALKHPIFSGDTLYAESEVVGLDGGNKEAGWGVVKLRTTGLNQERRVVGVLEYTFEMWGSDRSPRLANWNLKPVLENRFSSHLANADGVWVEQTGLFFEDWVVGENFIHSPQRVITTADSVTHALRSLEINPQYHSPEPYPLDILQTWVLAIVAALSTRTFGRVVANLGWKHVIFGHDPSAGSTIEANSTILELRDSSSRPHEGIVRVLTQAKDQHGEELIRFERTLLVYRRSSSNPYATAGY